MYLPYFMINIHNNVLYRVRVYRWKHTRNILLVIHLSPSTLFQWGIRTLRGRIHVRFEVSSGEYKNIVYFEVTTYSSFDWHQRFAEVQFNPRSVRVGFLWTKWHLDRVFFKYIGFPFSVIPPMVHAHSFNYHRHCIILAKESVAK